MKKILNTSLILLIFSLVQFGCAHRGTTHTYQLVEQSKSLGFEPQIISTKDFDFFGLQKIKTPGLPLVVYLEGDGHSKAGKYRLSEDPTPHQPIALELALQDNRPNVLYLARPCQYPAQSTTRNCHPKYWSSHKLSTEVVNSSLEAINVTMSHAQADSIQLVGFSGGGGLAALVAQRFEKTLSLITVAGDLDLDLMRTHHNTGELFGSLNPKTLASTISNVPQLHFAGGKDRIVPPKVAHSFVEPMNTTCAQVHVLSDATHHSWAKDWPSLLELPMACSVGGQHAPKIPSLS